VRAGEEFPGAAETGLNFIGNKDDAAIATDLRQSRQKAGWRHDESTFTQYRLDHDGGNGFSSHHATEGLVELFRYLFRCHRSPVGEPRIGGHAKRDAVNIRQKGAKTLLVRVSLAGQRHAQHGAAMKSVFDRDDRGTPGESARDLHRVLDCFCSAVDQERLLSKFARRELVKLLRHLHITFVASDLKAEMEKRIQLGTKSTEHPRIALANVAAADTAAQVEEAVAVYILEHRAFRMADKEWSGGVDPTRDGLRPAGRQRTRIGPRNFCLESDAGHSFNTIQSALRSD